MKTEGIGIEKAARIFYRGFINYLTRRSTFSDARKATIRAAEELHGEGSKEAKEVAAAWSAVGVEDNNTLAPVANTNPLKFLDELHHDHFHAVS
ncbi:MAG: M4 family metallopeptidase [Myxococcota bacterium]